MRNYVQLKYWLQKKSESGAQIVFVLFREMSCKLIYVKNFTLFWASLLL